MRQNDMAKKGLYVNYPYFLCAALEQEFLEVLQTSSLFEILQIKFSSILKSVVILPNLFSISLVLIFIPIVYCFLPILLIALHQIKLPFQPSKLIFCPNSSRSFLPHKKFISALSHIIMGPFHIHQGYFLDEIIPIPDYPTTELFFPCSVYIEIIYLMNSNHIS